MLCGQSCEDLGRGGGGDIGVGAFERATLPFHAPLRTKANEKKRRGVFSSGVKVHWRFVRIKSAAVVSLVSEKENEMSVTQRPARCATELRRSLGRLWLHIELPLPSFLPSFLHNRPRRPSISQTFTRQIARYLTHSRRRQVRPNPTSISLHPNIFPAEIRSGRTINSGRRGAGEKGIRDLDLPEVCDAS